MKITHCYFCNKLKYTPFEITEVEGGQATETLYCCKQCGESYVESMFNKKTATTQKVELSTISTPQQLVDFISGLSVVPKTQMPACSCGMTENEFDTFGRMGCAKCYDHFSEKMDNLVYPYHGANKHTGKAPKNRALKEPQEKLKLLKLLYAKALELEEFEKLPDLKRQIEEVTKSL